MSSVNTNTQRVKFSYRDYLYLNTDKRYEIINGNLYMLHPFVAHQLVLLKLERIIYDWVNKKDLGEATDIIQSEVIKDLNIKLEEIFTQ
jgi:hypothetical protein